MTYEEKKAWLRRYQQAKRLEQLRLDELDTLKTDPAVVARRAARLCRAAEETAKHCPVQ